MIPLICVCRDPTCADNEKSYAEKNYEDFLMSQDQMFFGGLCSGMFAAAAITSTPTLSTLVPVAVQTVLLAFRTGNHVAAMAERLYPAGEQSESWTYVLPGLSSDEARAALNTFNQLKVMLGPRAKFTFIVEQSFVLENYETNIALEYPIC